MGVANNYPLRRTGSDPRIPDSGHSRDGESGPTVFRCGSCVIAGVHPQMMDEQHKQDLIHAGRADTAVALIQKE